jgi:hypothetical protein
MWVILFLALLIAPIPLRGMDFQYSTTGIKPKKEAQLYFSLFGMEESSRLWSENHSMGFMDNFKMYFRSFYVFMIYIINARNKN